VYNYEKYNTTYNTKYKITKYKIQNNKIGNSENPNNTMAPPPPYKIGSLQIYTSRKISCPDCYGNRFYTPRGGKTEWCVSCGLCIRQSLNICQQCWPCCVKIPRRPPELTNYIEQTNTIRCRAPPLNF